MRVRLLIVGLAICLAATPAAEMKLTVDQLVSFIRSSIKLDHQDGKVANYLKDIVLTEKLDASTVEDLQGLGAGPKTIQALDRLREASAGLRTRTPTAPPKKLPPLPPPSPEEQKRIIEEARDYALNYSQRLPDFICTEVTRRYADPTGLEFWYKLDTVTAKLTYFEQKEDYKVILVDNRPVDIGMDQLPGSTSTGEFGTMMKEIFDLATQTSFRWQRWGRLRGKLMHVYSYYVSRDKSKWAISFEKKQRTIPAYRGLIYVDKDTLTVTRITLEAVNIEPAFPIQEAGTVLDYDHVTIAGGKYMLPLKFVMRMRQGKLLVRNEVEFRLYRKFGAEATISFDTPEPLPEEMTTEQPPTQ